MGAVFQLCHFKSKKPKRHLTACYHESYRPLKNRLPDSSDVNSKFPALAATYVTVAVGDTSV